MTTTTTATTTTTTRTTTTTTTATTTTTTMTLLYVVGNHPIAIVIVPSPSLDFHHNSRIQTRGASELELLPDHRQHGKAANPMPAPDSPANMTSCSSRWSDPNPEHDLPSGPNSRAPYCLSLHDLDLWNTVLSLPPSDVALYLVLRYWESHRRRVR